MNNPEKSHVLAFDFDGVIARYDGFKGPHHANEPISEVVKVIRTLKKEGHKILIHSTRGEEFLKDYCEKYDLPVDYFNRRPDLEGENPGKPIAFVYIDDRAILYKGQSAEDLLEEIRNFKAHWKN
jgi:phosphoglycolate phosphatase-like HAD superfamily hydrolase